VKEGGAFKLHSHTLFYIVHLIELIRICVCKTQTVHLTGGLESCIRKIGINTNDKVLIIKEYLKDCNHTLVRFNIVLSINQQIIKG